MDELRRELLVCLHQLRHARGVLASLTLAIGLSVGANLAMSAQLYDALAGSSPFLDSGRLFIVETAHGYGADDQAAHPVNRRLSRPDFSELVRQQQVFTAVGGYNGGYIAMMTGGDRPRTICRIFVTAQTLELLGIRSIVGRPLAAADFEANAQGVVLLTDTVWRTYFASDSSVVGRSIQLDEQPFSVAGVIPGRVADMLQPRTRLFAARKNDLCVVTPLVRGMAGEADGTIEYLRSQADMPWLVTIGRLRPGIPQAKVEADVSLIGDRLRQQNPGRARQFTLRAIPLDTWRTAAIRPLLVILAVAAGLTLLVACANAAGLLMAETLRRAPELATRMVLGAGRAHIVRIVLLRAVLWSVPGGVLGVLLASVANGLSTWRLMPAGAPENAHILATSVGLAAALTLVVALTSGGAAAWALRSRDWSWSFRAPGQTMGGHSRQRAAMVLLTLQMAAAVALAMGAGLLLRSIRNVETFDYGFQLQHGFVMEIRLPRSRFKSAADQLDFYDRALSRVRGLPGVAAAGFSSSPPFTNAVTTLSGDMALQTGEERIKLDRINNAQLVGSGYFEALGMRLVRGRFFQPQDDRRGVAAIVDEAFSRRYLGVRDPLGAVFRSGRDALPIVGVVGDTQRASVADWLGARTAPSGTVYLSMSKFTQAPTFRFLVVRSELRREDVRALVVRELLSVHPSAVVGDPISFTNLLRTRITEPRRLSALLSALAFIVVLLTATSMTAALSHLVTLRTVEIAIRYSLGAGRRQILALIAKHLAAAVGGGVLLGVFAGLLVGQGLVNQLHGVSSTDARTLTLVLALLALIGVVSSAGPLRRAFRIDPAQTMRGF